MQRLFITSYESVRFIQTTACTPWEVCLIFWVKHSQFFAFHLSLCTNDSYHVLKSGNILFWVLQFFCSSKNFRNSSSSRLTDCSLSMLQDGGTSCLSHSLSTAPRILEKRFSMTSSEKIIERLLGSIHYISHSVSMPFAHDQYTINWLIIGYRWNITRDILRYSMINLYFTMCMCICVMPGI